LEDALREGLGGTAGAANLKFGLKKNSSQKKRGIRNLKVPGSLKGGSFFK